MPAASVCSHTTSPYHTIGGRTDGKRCIESHDNSLVFGHNDLKNQSNLLKKNTTKITIRAEHVWSECRPRES